MAASLIISSSVAPTSPLKQCRPALSSANYFGGSRTPKRSYEANKTKRSMHSHAQRESGQSYSRLEREARHNEVPSGSTESTTVPRRLSSTTSGGYKQSNHQPYSQQKAARKKAKQGRSKPAPTEGQSLSPLPGEMKSCSKVSNGVVCTGGGGELEQSTCSVVDSGRGEELSSSCDSDSQCKLAGGGYQGNCAPQLCGAKGSCPSSCCSDEEDDLFQDALSNLPSADCSASTSAFMTPLSTRSRSQSPLLSLTNNTGSHHCTDHCPATEQQAHFVQSLTDSLQKIETDRTMAKAASTESPSELCQDTGRAEADSALPNKAGKPRVEDKDKDSTGTKTTSREKSKVYSKKRLNGITTVQSPSSAATAKVNTGGGGELVVAAADQLRSNGKKFSKSRKKKKASSEAAQSSSCDSSLTSGTKKSSTSSLRAPVQSSKQGSASHSLHLQISVECSSASSASPSSSVCSHSPLTLSPSPTSSFTLASSEHSICPSSSSSLNKIGRSNLTTTTTTTTTTATAATDTNTSTKVSEEKEEGRDEGKVEGKKDEEKEEKDEWPDLGMDYTTPKVLETGVHLLREVEAKAFEGLCLSPSSSVEPVAVESGNTEPDSGCNMSMSSSSESCGGTGGGGGEGGFNHQSPLEALMATPPYPPILTSHCYTATATGDVLSPQFGDPHLQSQQLQMHREQLQKFVEQHREQQEKQTDEHIFYPIEPLNTFPESALFAAQDIQPCPLLFSPPQQYSKPPPTIFHLHQAPPHSPQAVALPFSQPAATAATRADLPCPPTPPPPPPLPVQPYKKAADNLGFASSELEVTKAEEEEYVFHPLRESWVMWYDKRTGTTKNHCDTVDYQAALTKLLAVSSIEEFWQLYNNVKSPAEMEQNCNLHFFKGGIDPMWEHPANQNGGKWVLTIRNDSGSLVRSWLEVLLLLIGGSVEKCSQVNGAVLSRRKKGDRISLWTGTKKEEDNLDICVHFIKSVLLAYDVKFEDTRAFVKKLAEGKNGLSLVFLHHQDSLKSGRSYQNDAHIMLTDHLDIILQKLVKLADLI